MARSVPGTLDRRDPRDLSLGTGISSYIIDILSIGRGISCHITDILSLGMEIAFQLMDSCP